MRIVRKLGAKQTGGLQPRDLDCSETGSPRRRRHVQIESRLLHADGQRQVMTWPRKTRRAGEIEKRRAPRSAPLFALRGQKIRFLQCLRRCSTSEGRCRLAGVNELLVRFGSASAATQPRLIRGRS